MLVELADGEARATAWGCDLSYDYVKINADYTSMIVQQPDGMMAKEEKVANYTPAFKRTLLVEALKYIGHFSGQVAVIKYGGAAMVKESLKVAFAEDVALLKKVGLKPVVVHGGALGGDPHPGEAGGALRVRRRHAGHRRRQPAGGGDGADRQGEPGAGGSLLNARNANAVGLSGKDGTLLRAEKRGAGERRRPRLRGAGRRGQPAVPADVPRRRLRAGHLAHRHHADDGTGLSINADEVAAAVAAALGARKLIYLTDVAGHPRVGARRGAGAADHRPPS